MELFSKGFKWRVFIIILYVILSTTYTTVTLTGYLLDI